MYKRQAQSGDLGALFGVSDFAVADYAVLNAADGTNFGFDGQALSLIHIYRPIYITRETEQDRDERKPAQQK